MHKNRMLACYLLLAALITAAYWITWFLIPSGRSWLASRPDDTAYIVFENAFVLADSWLTISCLIAAFGLLRHKRWTAPWLFMAGSAAAYLAAMDVLFDVQNGIYLDLGRGNTDAVFTEIAINLGCIALAVWSIRVGFAYSAHSRADNA